MWEDHIRPGSEAIRSGGGYLQKSAGGGGRSYIWTQESPDVVAEGTSLAVILLPVYQC